MSSPESQVSPYSVGDLPIALKLPDEIWIQILQEVEDYEILKRARRICKLLKGFIDGIDFDDYLFRLDPPSPPFTKGDRVELHPLLTRTEGQFAQIEDAITLEYGGRYKSCAPIDYPSILEEFATRPTATKIIMDYASIGLLDCEPLVNPSGITVKDFLIHLADYWSIECTTPWGINEPHIASFGEHKLGALWHAPEADADNSVVVVPRFPGS